MYARCPRCGGMTPEADMESSVFGVQVCEWCAGMERTRDRVGLHQDDPSKWPLPNARPFDHLTRTTKGDVMKLAGIKPGDILQANVKGREFYAEVVKMDGREVLVEPITRNVSFHRVTARQVIGLWRKSRAS